MPNKGKLERYAPYGIWAFFVFFCVHYAIEIAKGGNDWKTGDWLINYSEGPIRRGFTGTLLLTISDSGVPLLWLTYLFQVLIYVAIFIFVLKLYQRTQRSLFWLLILYSPAFLLFSFYDLNGGFRKEIIIFMIFSYFCLIYSNSRITRLKLALIVISFGIAALSHELAIFTLPFFLYLLYLSAKEKQITGRIAIIYSFLFVCMNAIILLFAHLYKGDLSITNGICLALTNRSLDPAICDGSIKWLGVDSTHFQNRVINEVSYKSILTPLLLIVSISPLFFTTWWRKETVVLLVISALSFAPLFFITIDWGRWIYIIAFMIFCLALAEKVSVRFSYKKSFLILGLIYLTAWSIPHCCVGGMQYGFIGTLKHYSSKFLKNK